MAPAVMIASSRTATDSAVFFIANSTVAQRPFLTSTWCTFALPTTVRLLRCITRAQIGVSGALAAALDEVHVEKDRPCLLVGVDVGAETVTGLNDRISESQSVRANFGRRTN